MVVMTVLNVECETLVVCLRSLLSVPIEEYVSNKHSLPAVIRNSGINLGASVNCIQFYYNYVVMHNLNFTLK
jgi:hypothetical protein